MDGIDSRTSGTISSHTVNCARTENNMRAVLKFAKTHEAYAKIPFTCEQRKGTK